MYFNIFAENGQTRNRRMFPKMWILMTNWVLHWFLGKISNIFNVLFAYWYNYSISSFIMSFHQLFRNSINMSQKCLKYPVCNKHNSKSNIVNFINIFSDPNIISSTRSTEIVSESDSSPLQEHATLRKRKRRRHIDLDGARSPSSKKKLKFMPTSKMGWLSVLIMVGRKKDLTVWQVVFSYSYHWLEII